MDCERTWRRRQLWREVPAVRFPRILAGAIAIILAQLAPAAAQITLVAHTSITPSGTTGGSSPPISTASASLIVLSVSTDQSVSFSVSDNLSNTWILVASHNDGVVNNGKGAMYYCSPCNTGLNHIFATSSLFSTMAITAWGDAASSAPFDVQTSNGNSSTTIQPGPVTPSTNNSLVVSSLEVTASGNGTSASINSGFTISDQVPFTSGHNYGGATAYLVQGAAAAVNPTWTVTGGSLALSSVIAVFKQQAISSTQNSSKIDSYPVAVNGTSGAMSASKIVTYIFVGPKATTGFLHSFPP